MSVYRNLSLFILFSFLSACSPSEKTDESKTAGPAIFKLEKYEAGQVWNFNAPPGDDSASITVLKVERTEKGDTVVHVRLDNIRVYNPEIKDKYTRSITHLPFSWQAMDSSVTNLKAKQAELPEYLSGYLKWKEAYDRNEGGYWKVSAIQVLDQMNRIMYERYK